MSKSLIWILNILYWMLFLALLVLFYSFIALAPGFERLASSRSGGFIFWVKLMTGFAIIPALIAFYSFYTFLFNIYLAKKKFFMFCLTGLFISILASIIGALAESTELLFGKNYMFNDGYRSALSILLFMTIGAFINGAIGAIMKGFISWYGDIKLKEELRQKNFEMELDLIRMQVNPHFLFNTINNIDVLIEKDREKASAYFKKLSDILRFMLYETKSEKIPVSKELLYIEKYLDLQQLRTSNPAFVDFGLSGNSEGFEIEPMIFIPFIENAFKHAQNRKEVHGISIQFGFTERDIIFFCSNSYLSDQNNRLIPGGLGNGLIEKRLELLYPGSHKLTVEHKDGRHIVHLILQNVHQ